MSLQPRSPLHDYATDGNVVALLAAIRELSVGAEETIELLTWVLVTAAEANQVEAAATLVQNGALVNGGAQPRPYIRPLWKAAKRGHLEMVRFLVDHGASSEMGDNDGMLPIDYAKRYGRVEVVKYLQRLGQNGA